MELLTNKTLWEGFDACAEQLDVTVAKIAIDDKFTFKKIYFTGRTFASGRKTRVCANVCYPNKKPVKSVLLIGESNNVTSQDLYDIAQNGFLAMSVDVDGRTSNGCGTMFPEEVDYCNAVANKDLFFFDGTVRNSKLYEQSLCCMRAITYLVECENVQTISVVTIGNYSTVGAIVCAQDNRVTNGMFLFGTLNVDYPDADIVVDDKASLQDQFAHDDKSQAWTMGLAPQSYLMNITVPVYVVNSANSHAVDVVEVSKAFNRLNDQSRLLIIPDLFDCVDARYVKNIINWCKGVNAQQDYDIDYFEQNGDYFVNVKTSAKLADTSVWYCTNANLRAKHWVQAKLQQTDDGYVAKLDLYEQNCNVVAFVQIADKLTVSSTLLEIPVKNANVKMANSIVFTGEGNREFIAVSDPHVWMFTKAEPKRKKGYLDIVGAQGNCLATFALADACVKKNSSFAVSFDICATEQQPLTIAVVCNYGITNDVYVATKQLVGDGKWQRITVETADFLSNNHERSKNMPVEQIPQLLVLKSQQTFLVNNVILV